jgi:putative hydrolase of the HAD superfamily
VICTGAWGPGFGKPHPRAFEAVEAWSGRSGCNLVYVADNPTKDFVTPRARGWQTVQILRPERVHHLEAPDAAHEAHAAITSLDELDDCVARLHGIEDPVCRSPDKGH